MKHSVYEQFVIVKEDSTSLFTAKLNEELYRLRDYNPTVKFHESDPLCAYIHYTVSVNTPETVAEASEASGVSFVCAQCPYFIPPTKADGEPDRRCKYGDCEHAELGRTFKTSPACEKLYQLIKEGDICLRFME